MLLHTKTALPSTGKKVEAILKKLCSTNEYANDHSDIAMPSRQPLPFPHPSGNFEGKVFECLFQSGVIRAENASQSHFSDGLPVGGAVRKGVSFLYSKRKRINQP
jgi:hypothetical protein